MEIDKKHLKEVMQGLSLPTDDISVDRVIELWPRTEELRPNEQDKAKGIDEDELNEIVLRYKLSDEKNIKALTNKISVALKNLPEYDGLG